MYLATNYLINAIATRICKRVSKTVNNILIRRKEVGVSVKKSWTTEGETEGLLHANLLEINEFFKIVL